MTETMIKMRTIRLVVLVAGLWALGSFGAARADETSFPRDDELDRQVATLKEKMLNDTDIMALIAEVQNDPEIQQLLADPAAVEAARKGDIQALVANPRFMQLLDNPRIREIQRKVHP
jgi:hypothetical protein